MSDLLENSDTIPDILQPKPLERAVNVNVETNILEPVVHEYNPVNGGVCRFVFPAKGVLDAPNCTINFEMVCGDANNVGVDRQSSFPLWAGGLALFKRATFRCGGQILSQIQDCGLYATMKSGFNSKDYQQNVVDVKHMAMNGAFTKHLNAPAGEAAEAGYLGGNAPWQVPGYSQVMNPYVDQQNVYGCQAEGVINANVVHVKQTNKLLRNYTNRGQGSQVAIRLSDLFPYFKENMLPLLGMAQCELEIEWNASVANTVQLQQVTENVVIPANPDQAAATTNQHAQFAATPFMALDYIHYPDIEREKIMAAIQRGLTMNFREVVRTKGVNPALAATGATQTNVPVASSHLLGMAGKAVQNIYVVKQAQRTNQTQAQLDMRLNGVPVVNNHQFNQFKSVNTVNEKYNIFINNNKLYNRDIDNSATQYHYLSQCERKYACMPCEYDAFNYDADWNNVLNNASVVGAADNTQNNNGETGRWHPGQKHVIGIPLMKYPEMGSVPGNETRQGSAPIEFTYECAKTLANPAVPATDTDQAIDLTFFIEYRRSMTITPMGVNVSDL
jgi:hypothetical protein